MAMLWSAPSQAQMASRTWVSSTGDDVNPCSRTSPCKTFPGALSKTLPGGEINCVDSAGYGATRITKSVTIDCSGVFGSINASHVTGIIIDGDGIVVTLRDIAIDGGTPDASGINGIHFVRGAALHLHKVEVFNFAFAGPGGNGIQITPSTGTAEIFVSDSYIHDNGLGTTGSGIQVRPTGNASVNLTVRGARIDNNASNGIRIDSSATTGLWVRVSIEESHLAGGSQGLAVLAGSASATPAIVSVNRSVIANNASFGIIGNGGGTSIFVGDSTITGNGFGVMAVGSARIGSYGDNRLSGNGDSGTFSIPTVPKM
ncbi:right-handed parallel beta-helix repeat-containing protein [Sphingomonas parva]|nr:right-handed parallel beta-helix repeat-containing protein [Sphingomonas parva]